MKQSKTTRHDPIRTDAEPVARRHSPHSTPPLATSEASHTDEQQSDRRRTTMDTSPVAEAQFLLRKLVTSQAADAVDAHPWLWEFDRWEELTFALMTRVVDLPEAELRELTERLGEMGLLNVDVLASIREGANASHPSNPASSHILTLLQESGFTDDEAKRTLTTISEAALALQRQFGGKIQRYLRTAGEAMLRDVDEIFQFSAIGNDQVKAAFTYWFQNALSMPLSLLDSDVQTFCNIHHIATQELILAADDLDINLALLDDLIAAYQVSSREELQKQQ